MKGVLVGGLALALVAVCGGGSSAAGTKGPEVVTINSKMGRVVFPHQVHQKVVKNCETCHHMGIEAGACRSCHGQRADAPKAKEAFHRLCKGCHLDKHGPTSCTDCHKK